MAANEDGSGPREMPAVRTTIVGGRPPGCGRGLGNIPRGVEVLVKKAAVDAAFRALLLERRAGAAREIGLPLTPAETQMLEAVPPAQLEAIIAGTRVDDRVRPAFLGKVAAAMLAALGVAAVVADAAEPLSRGVRPDNPPATQTASAEAPVETAGARPLPLVFPVAGAEARPPGVERVPVPMPAQSQPTTTSQPASQSQPATQAGPLSAEQTAKLIAQLDSDDYKTRETAQQELMAAMPGIAPALREALASGKCSPEQSARLQRVLDAAKPRRPEPPISVNGLRAN